MIGIVGAGTMARALARGWGEPVLCTDAGSGRALELVAEVGGEAVADNTELAERAELVVLCHKPQQLEQVAADVDGRPSAVISILSGVPLAALRAAYPRTPVLRLAVNLLVEVRQGVVCYAPAEVDGELEDEVLARFARLGRLVQVDESLIPAVIAVSGVGPAYLSLIIEAQVDAAVRHGLPSAVAAELALRTMAGTATLLETNRLDPVGVRRAVGSPGGPTTSGLAALERAGVRGAFHDAADAVVEAVRAATNAHSPFLPDPIE